MIQDYREPVCNAIIHGICNSDSYDIIKTMGEIKVETKDNKGTVVTIQLPVS